MTFKISYRNSSRKKIKYFFRLSLQQRYCRLIIYLSRYPEPPSWGSYSLWKYTHRLLYILKKSIKNWKIKMYNNDIFYLKYWLLYLVFLYPPWIMWLRKGQKRWKFDIFMALTLTIHYTECVTVKPTCKNYTIFLKD